MALKILLLSLVTAAILWALFSYRDKNSRFPFFAVCLLLAIALSATFAKSRHHLVPYNADETRRAALLAGDEPCYLFGALSLARDGNIDVSNNIANQDYLVFQNRPGWGWDFDFFNRISNYRLENRRDDWGEKRYSQHRPGTMAFLAPVFFFTDRNVRWWSYTLISSVVVFFALFVCWYGRSAGLGVNVSAGICLVFLLSPPILFYANQAYPEVLCASLLGMSFLLATRGGAYLYLSTALLCAVLWFSDRVLPAAFILAFFVFFSAHGWKQRTVLCSMLAVGYALFAVYCWHRFGVPYPLTHDEAYGFNFARIVPRFLQISFDRVQGWVWLFPSALLIPFIAWDLLRDKKKRTIGITIVLMLLASLALIAVFNDWRGGTNPRGRFYVIAQILFLCMVVVSLRDHLFKERKYLLFLLACLGALSLAQLPWLIQQPNWWFRSYHPFFGLEAIQKYYTYLPDLPDAAPGKEWLKLVYWAPLLAFPSASCFWLYAKKGGVRAG